MPFGKKFKLFSRFKHKRKNSAPDEDHAPLTVEDGDIQKYRRESRLSASCTSLDFTSHRVSSSTTLEEVDRVEDGRFNGAGARRGVCVVHLDKKKHLYLTKFCCKMIKMSAIQERTNNESVVMLLSTTEFSGSKIPDAKTLEKPKLGIHHRSIQFNSEDSRINWMSQLGSYQCFPTAYRLRILLQYSFRQRHEKALSDLYQRDRFRKRMF
ncbi:hypothetical protein CLF_103097 [Clonorchis sinensis]|uniref:Uncharacterized protein n=1 Tax=Clonorchis sinensis TaxID=79923 RepID=G7Y931_CLOSI|nr:hypothetical protein CLF_103097 [Clonorchis sinensis]